jgi:hypothetical protein
MKATTSVVLSFVFILTMTRDACAWLYPEHRDIMYRAIERLDDARRKQLDELWLAARRGFEKRLTSSILDTSRTEKHDAIDYPAWSAIGGDHSCSPKGMLDNVLHTDWILEVADITSRLKRKIAEAGTNRAKRINAMRDADIELQRADPEYATRAGSNNVHFLLSRRKIGMSPKDYSSECYRSGTPLNALGAYGWYHYSALEKALRLKRETLSDDERSKLTLSMLADEAFALHFLEDVFASGHVAGTWGDASQRKGTHDYYNEHGIETETWDKKTVILVGDAWMRDEDCELAATTVRKSIEQIIDASMGVGQSQQIQFFGAILTTPDTLDVCSGTVIQSRQVDSMASHLIVDVIRSTPIPGLTEGLGQLPRFRSELGTFIGLAPAARAGTYFGGFSEKQTQVGAGGGLDMALRFGLGLEGVINESGDGLAFLDVGIRQDAASSSKFGTNPVLAEGGSITATIPARSAYTLRIRMPFWLVPFDLLIAAPLALISTDTYTAMAVVAGNGGVIPWQAGIASSIGRFQVMLGREVGVSFYGYGSEEDRFFFPTDSSKNTPYLVAMRSIKLDFPVLEYRPFRTFSTDQSSSLIIQLGGAVDFPTVAHPISPVNLAIPHLDPIWSVGIRLVFDWRYYF